MPSTPSVAPALGSPQASWWSWRSTGSVLSIASDSSVLSIGSVGSVGSVLSLGSFGSVLSVGSSLSAASILSNASAGSVLSHASRLAFTGDHAEDHHAVIAVGGAAFTVLTLVGYALLRRLSPGA